MTGSLGPTSTYATPSPRKSLSKVTDCLARPGQSRRSPHTAHSAAHTALAANTACQASRSLHSAMHATHRGLRLSLLAPRRMHALASLGSYCPAAGRRAPARARAPARTSCSLHGACPRRLLPASSPIMPLRVQPLTLRMAVVWPTPPSPPPGARFVIAAIVQAQHPSPALGIDICITARGMSCMPLLA